MAILPVADRQRVWRGLMRYVSNNKDVLTGNVVKADLQDAVNYTDDWIDANQANWNNGLPPVIKNNLTLQQKTVLFCAVAAMRAGVGLIRALLGSEVD